VFRQKSPLALGLTLAAVGVLIISVVVICARKPPPPPPPAPAAFQIAKFAISPAEVAPGGKVTISAEVTNTGGTEGSYIAKLIINGLIEATREITLATGASQLLVFSISKDAPGTYKVSWEKLFGEFIVTKPLPPPKPTVRTKTLTDADATRLLLHAIPGSEIHFLPNNKVQMKYYAIFNFTFDCGVTDGKLWLAGVPGWVVDFLSIEIREYTSYNGGKLFLTALPPWFDPTKEFAPEIKLPTPEPDVTGLPAMNSIETMAEKAILIYRWP